MLRYSVCTYTDCHLAVSMVARMAFTFQLEIKWVVNDFCGGKTDDVICDSKFSDWTLGLWELVEGGRFFRLLFIIIGECKHSKISDNFEDDLIPACLWTKTLIPLYGSFTGVIKCYGKSSTSVKTSDSSLHLQIGPWPLFPP